MTGRSFLLGAAIGGTLVGLWCWVFRRCVSHPVLERRIRHSETQTQPASRTTSSGCQTTRAAAADPVVRMVSNSPPLVSEPGDLLIHRPSELMVVFLNTTPVSTIPDANCSRVHHFHDTECQLMDVVRTMLGSNSTVALVHGAESIESVDWIGSTTSLLKSETHRREFATVPATSTTPETPILSVIRLLQRGVRYVLVCDGKRVRKVVSQASIWRWIWTQTNNPSLIDFFETLRTTGCLIGPHSIHTTTETHTARQAFSKMIQYGVGSLPILDEDQRIVGVISMTDACFLGTSTEFGSNIGLCLALPVSLFISKSLRHRVQSPSSRPTHPVVVGTEDTLWDVVDKLIENRVHHIYVVDPNGTPVSVVSYGDLLRFLF